MTASSRREPLDRRVEEIRRLMRARCTVVDPGPHFADRVVARLPRNGGWMLAWAARRVLPVTLALAAVMTIAAIVTDGSASRQAESAEISSTSQRVADPLDWLLENGRGAQ